ncbi:uncharacterized protein At4g37920 [Nymphaea colorata]|nr:uncharacterized protein At4g37920 [Nymphaea colorata]
MGAQGASSTFLFLPFYSPSPPKPTAVPFLPHRSSLHLPAATILPLSFKSNSPRFVSAKIIGSCSFPLDGSVFMRRSCLQAVSDDTAAAPAPTTSSKDGEPSGSHSNDVAELEKEFNEHGNSDNEQAEFGEHGDSDSSVDEKMIRVCDKLIEVFMVDKPTTADWRRLLAFSKQWDDIRPHFYRRCQSRADAESDSDMKHKLYRLGRKLKEVNDDMQRHNELLSLVRQTPSEINAIVAKRRKDFTAEFFEHMHVVAESYYDNLEEQDGLINLRLTCLAAVQAYDNASESVEALDAAELKFKEILNSPSLGEACKKIDALAEKNQLDSALVLMLTKAWSTAKESTMMKDEVKDVLYHLYVTARGNLQRLVPKEIRILKYLLTIEDPKQQLSALKDAFTPGDELEGNDVDCLYTTPDKLHTWIRTVVDAYHFSREGTLIREARDLMNPTIMQRLEQLKIMVEKNFM